MTAHPVRIDSTKPVAEPSIHERLEPIWRNGPGLWGWLTSVNHKSIALRSIITAFGFFALGGVEAALMRAQLARPENSLIGPDLYNQLFTVHGSTMMFLFAVPIVQSVALYFVPIMIGTRNVAFPRLNAFGYWTYLIGGVLLYAGLFTNTGPDQGWFSYVPLAGPEFTPGKRADIWAQMITFTEIAAIVAAIEVIVTVLKQRAPGMSLNRVPLFVWAMVVMSFMVLVAMPFVATSSIMLAMDRLIATQFFNPAEGGDALLWQHLFWFFAHPEVYIIFIPALGIISSVVATFSRRPIFGYTAMVLSLIATGFLSFGLWVHHMFATPLPQTGQSFFTAASAMIAIPTGVQIFCWIATIWAGRPRFTTPMLFMVGFIALFVIGGLTGLMLAAVPLDLQLTDTFFLPGHIHYVLLGGMVFPLLGGVFYWFPKVTGRMLNERLGKISFWLLFIGVNVTFFPQLLLGIAGMPRRVYTYAADTGWGLLNLTSSVGAVMLTLGVVILVVNIVRALASPRNAGADPWGGETLEWATASPAPDYNFAYIPIVHGRSPMWDDPGAFDAVAGLREDRREILCTTALDAEPDSRHQHPDPTIMPLLTALGVGLTLIWGIFDPIAFVVGPALTFLPLLAWGWPKKPKPHSHEIIEVPE